jgi:hypothetical protein
MFCVNISSLLYSVVNMENGSTAATYLGKSLNHSCATQQTPFTNLSCHWHQDCEKGANKHGSCQENLWSKSLGKLTCWYLCYDVAPHERSQQVSFYGGIPLIFLKEKENE